MTKEELLELRKKLARLSDAEKKQRDLYLRKVALGEIQGEKTGYPSIDKPWLKYYTEETIESTLEDLSACDFIYYKNINHLDKAALAYFSRHITYREMFDNINICAKALKEYGVKEGDVVSISLPNIPEAAYLFYAISKIGAIANMIDPRASVEGIEEYLNEVNSKVLFMIDVANPKIVNVKKNTSVRTVVNVSPADSLPLPLSYGFKVKSFLENIKKKQPKVEGFDNWNNFFEKGKLSNVSLGEVEGISEKPVLIVHTGGTTGSPKGVILTNKNINAIPYQSMAFPTDLQSKHKWLDIMPPFIAYGIGTGLHFPLAVGMEDILIPAFDPEKFDKLLMKYKPNHISGVPSHWNSIIKSKVLKDADLSFLITPAVGGDTMDKTLEINSNKFLAEHGCNYEIVKGYGMTEMNGSIGRSLNDENLIGSVGIPFAQSNVKICNPETGEELGYNEQGEIYMTGPSMMLEYYNNEEETSKVKVADEFGQYWIKSGDLGYMTEDGNIFIIDRIKRIIIRHDGFKVFPSVIEEVIEKHENVKMCKVVGMPDNNNIQGELPCAFIVLNDNNVDLSKIEDEIKDICYKYLPEYSLPKALRFKNELPLTPIGKIDTLKLGEKIKEELQGESRILNKNNNK